MNESTKNFNTATTLASDGFLRKTYKPPRQPFLRKKAWGKKKVGFTPHTFDRTLVKFGAIPVWSSPVLFPGMIEKDVFH